MEGEARELSDLQGSFQQEKNSLVPAGARVREQTVPDRTSSKVKVNFLSSGLRAVVY